jgi:hypothetical protein
VVSVAVLQCEACPEEAGVQGMGSPCDQFQRVPVSSPGHPGTLRKATRACSRIREDIGAVSRRQGCCCLLFVASREHHARRTA